MGAALGRCVILGGGEIADDAAILARLRPQDCVFCADSGYDHCTRLGLVPQLLVGDFDSVQTALPEGVPRITLPREKDDSDTTYAMRLAVERGYRELLLIGMLGGRLDHTLGNLQNLIWLCRRGIKASLTDGCTEVSVLAGGERCTLLPQKRRYFSLLSLSERCEGVTISNAKYPLHNGTLTNDIPFAVSNEFLEVPVQISLHSGLLALLITPKDIKNKD